MKIKIQLFAIAKQSVGQDHIEVELRDSATIADLRTAMSIQHPDLAPLLPAMAFAIDAEYVRDDAPISPNADIACIPPVSGG